MKVKLDFVSNSSSTSFVYISDDELSEEAFLKAVGVDGNGPVVDVFRQMHFEICTSIQSRGKRITTNAEADRLAGSYEFTPDVIEKIKNSIQEGKDIYVSKLSSDGPLAESVLCMEMFEIESDAFYINAYNNYW